MATPPGRAGTTSNDAKEKSPQDLEAEIARLREDVMRLSKQLAATGEHSFSAVKRAANESAEQLRATGEAAVGAIRANAGDIENQLTEAVREKPITALALAAGVGFVFALLTRR